MVNTNF